MRKIVIFVAACVMTVSCGTSSKHYAGHGLGVSSDEQTAREIGEMSSAIDALKRNNYSVRSDEKVETTNENGQAVTVYTSTKKATSSTTFRENEFKVSSRKLGNKSTTCSLYGYMASGWLGISRQVFSREASM